MAPYAEVRDVPQRWEVISSSQRFRGRVIAVRTDLVRMPGDQLAERDVVEHPGAVAVLALDDADRVLLLRQYRHPVGYQLWEAPAGIRDVPGESLLVTAEREFREEAGYRAKDWHILVDYFSSPGMCDERVRVFLARGLTQSPAEEQGFQRVHEETDMPIVWLPLADAAAKVLAGDIMNPAAAIGVLAAHAAAAQGFAGLRPVAAPEA